MALRGDRIEAATDLSYFMNATGEKGQVVVFNTSGSGAAMDDPDATVAIPATTAFSPSGTSAAGVLLNDVVNLDLTRQHLNQHRNEVQVGSKVTLLTKGQITTNMITGAATAGQDAYYVSNDSAGKFTAVVPTDTTLEDATYKVGRFLSQVDSDGYIKIAIDIV